MCQLDTSKNHLGIPTENIFPTRLASEQGSLGDIILIDDWYATSQLTLWHATPRWVVLGAISKQVEWAIEKKKKPSYLYSSGALLHFLPPGSCPDCLYWCTVKWKEGSVNEAFPPWTFMVMRSIVKKQGSTNAAEVANKREHLICYECKYKLVQDV